MKILPFSADDHLKGVRDLFVERGLAFDEALFLWKKAAPRQRSWVGVEDGRVTAHYSIMELPLFPSFRAGFAVDGIFALSHSRMALIQEMVSGALRQAKQDGVHLVVGFANERMSVVKKFLGWKSIGCYRWRTSQGRMAGEPESSADKNEWGMIENVKAEQNGSDPGSDPDAQAYARWRWNASPRAYDAVVHGQRIVARMSGLKLKREAPLLVWHDPEAWQAIDASCRFSYLQREAAAGDKPDGESWVEPLFYPLVGQGAEWDWPVRWPLETVEGVTLGW